MCVSKCVCVCVCTVCECVGVYAVPGSTTYTIDHLLQSAIEAANQTFHSESSGID